MKSAEIVLASGFACAAVGIGLCLIGGDVNSPIWSIGLALVGVAFILVIGAGFVAHSAERIVAWQKYTGLVLYVVGVLLLPVAPLGMVAIVYSGPPKVAGEMNLRLVLAGLIFLVPVLLIVTGLRYRANWSWIRCALWVIVFLCVHAAILLFLASGIREI